MAERSSGYERKARDDYETPRWVTDALLSVERLPEPIWECAPGSGRMLNALNDTGAHTVALPSDEDFLQRRKMASVGSIITNPPYALADEFVEHALTFSVPVAMLLPVAWDTAKRRAKFFRDNERFRAKYILTRRIRWENLEQKASGPSMNHAWYVWSDGYCGLSPKIAWLPRRSQ
jgi:hypothetical protein